MVILLLAVLITRLGKQINEWRVWGMIAVLIGPLALLVTMNNLSSGIIICGIAFVMMFIACKRKWPFIATVALGITVIVFAPPVAIALEKAGILHSYQLSRILVWKNPGGVSEVRWISGPSGTVRHRFRRPSRKGTGTEYPEVKLPSGAAERYDLRGDL